MLELNKILFILIPFAIYFVSFWGRRILFKRKDSSQTMALIEKIQLQKIDNLWSPEVQVEYSFYLDGVKYTGKDFIRMDKFLKDSYFLLANRKYLPVLNSNEGQYIGEEHIEHHLLSKKKEISVEYNQKNPSESRIFKSDNQKNHLFQDIKTDFPWVH